MRRWNGWGDTRVEYPLPGSARDYLSGRLGPGQPLAEASLTETCAALPPSRLHEQPELDIHPETRLRHARGHSLPDWLALRSGKPGPVPDAVTQPESTEAVRRLLTRAREQDWLVIPCGGGTSVAGHINPPASQRPVLSVDLGRMNRLLDIDPVSRIARFGAGTTGPQVEAQLRAHGFTLGHYPQSFEYSTLGGWVATRSSGQQSLGYGRIEQLFAGGRLETLDGPLDLPPFPASAAGPDLRELVLGSEGRLGILTEIDVRISPLPEREAFQAWFFPDWDCGVRAARELIQQRLPLSMLRLATPEETAVQLALAGRSLPARLLEAWLAVSWAGRGGANKCLLLTGISGSRTHYRHVLGQTRVIVRRHRGRSAGASPGRRWARNRFRLPYLRESLWQAGYVIDTLETATHWSNLEHLLAGIEKALRQGLAEGSGNGPGKDGEQVLTFSHLSHAYPTGSSIYTTFLFRPGPDHETALERWRTLKQTASQFIVENGGTISHQHGVGRDHAPWLPAEKGVQGMRALSALCREFDLQGQLNPGALIATSPDTEESRT